MKKNKRDLVIFVLAGIILLIGLAAEIIRMVDYGKRVDSGNARWLQVEERIKRIEELCGCDGRNS